MIKMNLKVGDRVCHVNDSSWNRFVQYEFATVIRVTETQAVLDKTHLTKLCKDKLAEDAYYKYGNKRSKWVIETQELVELARVSRKRQTIYTWFENKKFTQEEKTTIYNLLNK
jgi:hypothetical protein